MKKAAIALLGACLAVAALVSPASAAEPPPGLWGGPEESPRVCSTGSGAGQCKIPRGIAADPTNGHIFVADQTNNRVDEFNAAGQFIKAWGWDVVGEGPDDDTLPPEDQFEICAPITGDVCKAGLGGSGEGQLSAPQGVALDSEGDVYVFDFFNQRVEKFNRKGEFLLAFGGPGAGPGQFGEMPETGSFVAIDKNDTPSSADDKVWVGDVKRIQRFNTTGEYQGEFALPVAERIAISLAVGPEGDLYAVYASLAGAIFPGIHKLTPGGVEVNAHGEPVAPGTPAFEVKDLHDNSVGVTALAVDGGGDVLVFGPASCCASQDNLNPFVEFDHEGNLIAEWGKGEFSGSTGIAANFCAGSEEPGNFYASNASQVTRKEEEEGKGKQAFLRAYGTQPVGCFKARTLPPSEVEELSATLNGTVNPSELPVSSCFFEFGTDQTYGESLECHPQASALGEGSEPVPVEHQLAGLQAGTVYHYRLLAKVGEELETGSDEIFKTKGPALITKDFTVAVNESEATLRALVNPEGLPTSCHFQYGVGEVIDHSTPTESVGQDRTNHLFVGSVKGLTPGTPYGWLLSCENTSGPTESALHAFTTYLPSGAQSCPNEAFRTGTAAFLSDCRAYEMVSPVDKNGGDIVTERSNPEDPGGYIQARPDGNLLTYTATPAFAGVQASMRFNQYLAARTERGQSGEGWASEGIRPPIAGDPALDNIGQIFGFHREFMAFTPDLCDAWLIDEQAPPLRPDGQDGYRNLYRRQNCGPNAGELETLTSEPPPKGTEPLYVDENSVQGVAADASQAIFYAKAALLPDARLFASGTQLSCATAASGTITYRWLRNGIPIGGATSSVYNSEVADKGKAIQCQVFASGEGAGSTQIANPPFVIAPAPAVSPPLAPREIAPPTQSAPLTVGGGGGQTLTCQPGSWQGSPTFVHQWYRNGTAIGGASESTYAVSAADLASAAVFQCVLTATTAGGSVSKASAPLPTAPGPSAKAPTSAGASMPSEAQLYDRSGGELHLVSVLPSHVANPRNSLVSGQDPSHAVSSDGSRVYWTNDPLAGSGLLYVRINPAQGIVPEECVAPAKACTIAVSKESAVFQAAAEDGSKAIYTESSPEGVKLFEFDLAKALAKENPRRTIAAGVSGVVGTSADLSRIYFVSTKALAGAGQNSEEDEAIEGQPNLYLAEGEAVRFVGTMSPKDVGEKEAGGEIAYNLVSIPHLRAARVTPDGSHLAFESRAPLTGFDNSDAADGRPDVEVYAYDATARGGEGQLLCISCNPGRSAPRSREMGVPYSPSFEVNPNLTNVPAAAWIPTWEHPLHASNVLSADGDRLFFNSNDPLLPRDANGAQDVYEWEAAGAGGCKVGGANYFAGNGGCLYLISSGESPFESEFWEASADGRDVFFTTESSLLSQDPGSIDLYDARVLGGFPQPTEVAACEGEACQSPPSPPDDPTPASSAFEGTGNVHKGAEPRCAKGRVKVRKAGKTRCVKKKAKRRHRANHHRRAAR